MVRPLTKIERVYVEVQMKEGVDAKEIADDIDGVGPITIQKYMTKLGFQELDIVLQDTNEVTEDENIIDENIIKDVKDLEARKGESDMDRDLRIVSSRTKTEDLMARDQEKGIVAMTEAASALTDARKALESGQAAESIKERQKEFIHKPFDNVSQSGTKDRTTRLIRK